MSDRYLRDGAGLDMGKRRLLSAVDLYRPIHRAYRSSLSYCYSAGWLMTVTHQPWISVGRQVRRAPHHCVTLWRSHHTLAGLAPIRLHGHSSRGTYL